MILIAPLLTLCQFGNLKSGIPEGKLKDGVETERLVWRKVRPVSSLNWTLWMCSLNSKPWLKLRRREGRSSVLSLIESRKLKNTAYFFAKANQRKRKKTIASFDNNGELITDSEGILQARKGA
jgi:hypothetical protein